jgi:hypothetical protein
MKTVRSLLFLASLGLIILAGQTLAADNDLAQSRWFLRDEPSDIVALGERAIGCRRLSSIVVTDQASDEEVDTASRNLRCDSLAADAEALRRKYAGSASRLKAIDAAYSLRSP